MGFIVDLQAALQGDALGLLAGLRGQHRVDTLLRLIGALSGLLGQRLAIAPVLDGPCAASSGTSDRQQHQGDRPGA
ncbi:hypothetical protein V466_28120 [Pseudomonas mandelii PD30]|uniref:Uncharacterized protein n=1 Tax=Pseudomonas mandelii PD30 TaxID=1419583 RepID=A0A059KVG5_9PSED|nr:hypothetical protein V466_28120 [Pseudomonas mandelii PD30]